VCAPVPAALRTPVTAPSRPYGHVPSSGITGSFQGSTRPRLSPWLPEHVAPWGPVPAASPQPRRAQGWHLPTTSAGQSGPRDAYRRCARRQRAAAPAAVRQSQPVAEYKATLRWRRGGCCRL